MVLENVDQAAGLDVLLGDYAGERAAASIIMRAVTEGRCFND